MPVSLGLSLVAVVGVGSDSLTCVYTVKMVWTDQNLAWQDPEDKVGSG